MATRTDPRTLRSRHAVLHAALELILERGIAGTTIEAVSERSGVAKSTIYRQWNNSPALAMDAFRSILRIPVDPDTGTLRGDLLKLVTNLAEALTHGPAFRLLPALIEAAERDSEFMQLHRREAATRHHVILNVIRRGIERGELPAGTDPKELLDLVAGPLFYRRMLSTPTVSPEFARRVVDVILAAYRSNDSDDMAVPID